MASIRKVAPLGKVIKQLIDDGKQFFVNSLLKPVVHIPDDPYQQYWEVTHELVPALRDLGIGGKIEHLEDGSHCKLQKLATFKPVADALEKKPSGQPSAATADPPKGTAAPDGSDGTDGSPGTDHPYVNQGGNTTAA